MKTLLFLSERYESQVRLSCLTTLLWFVGHHLSGHKLSFKVDLTAVVIIFSLFFVMPRVETDIFSFFDFPMMFFQSLLFLRVVMGSSRALLVKFPGGSPRYKQLIVLMALLGIPVAAFGLKLVFAVEKRDRKVYFWCLYALSALVFTVIFENGIISDPIIVIAYSSILFARTENHDTAQILLACRAFFLVFSMLFTLIKIPSRDLEERLFHVTMRSVQSRVIACFSAILYFIISPASMVLPPSESERSHSLTILTMYLVLFFKELYDFRTSELSGYEDDYNVHEE